MTRTRNGRHLVSVPHGDRRRLRAPRTPAVELAGLRGAFLAWLGGHGLPADVDEAALWADTVAVVDLAIERAALRDLRAWTTDQVSILADAGDDDTGPLAALPLLLAFLGDTGRWNGTPAQFEAALEAAEAASDPLAGVLDELMEVEVGDDAEDAALRALPLVRQAEALVRFLLPRRPVTGTGALRRADVAVAAELVGVDLRGHRPRSMWDVERLPVLWQGLADIELLAVAPTEVVPTPLAHAWVAGDAEAGRKARRMVLGGYLTELLTTPPAARWLPDPLGMLLPVLAAAALDRPMPAEALDDPDLDDADLGDPAAALLELAAFPARRLLSDLAEEGILAVSDTVGVAPGLRRVLARTVAALLRGVDMAGEPGAVPDLPPPDAATAGQAWRLRVELEGARPPVWREVLVDPAMPLDELHAVIQRLFGWADCHLHEFEAAAPGGRTATRYAPPGPDEDWVPFGNKAADEAGVRLSQVLGPRRGKLSYRYDFGDCWDHRIAVVGAEPAGGNALPRCTGGSGAAPHEDSGGVWGWADMVAAASDSRHPEHADVRDWLGLKKGERLDPTAFDPTEADERLSLLRR